MMVKATENSKHTSGKWRSRGDRGVNKESLRRGRSSVVGMTLTERLAEAQLGCEGPDVADAALMERAEAVQGVRSDPDLAATNMMEKTSEPKHDEDKHVHQVLRRRTW